jgi:hypothetical protein
VMVADWFGASVPYPKPGHQARSEKRSGDE